MSEENKTIDQLRDELWYLCKFGVKFERSTIKSNSHGKKPVKKTKTIETCNHYSRKTSQFTLYFKNPHRFIMKKKDKIMKVLIIDDFSLNREILTKFLVSIAKCDLVESGKNALIVIKDAIQKNDHYDLICLDLMMPEMDGFEVLKEIRRIEIELGVQPAKNTKIMITSELKDGDSVSKTIQLGCNGYLSKPYNKQNLKLQLEKMKLL